MGVPIDVTLLDRSPVALGLARVRAATMGMSVRCVEGDALTADVRETFDVVACSLFLHHLESGQAQTVLTRMQHWARRLVIVNDLRRTVAGWIAAWMVCRVLTRSPVVRYDGPVSVCAAWTPREVRALAQRAGLRGAAVHCVWPWRLVLTWSPEAAR
jgi:2-polyprenyl-3-methyl-5-hydroxy-6-metoxy-1,4-benzoquinol methylase